MRTMLLLVLCSVCLAQAPAFDVASLKPSPPLPPGQDTYSANLGSIRNNELALTNATLADCIKFAYSLVSDEQLSGPDWIKSKTIRFDVDAKAPAGTPRPEMLLMLRSLLAERFHLAMHPEPRSFSHLVMVVAKGGPKFREVQPDPPLPRKPSGLGHIAHPQASMFTLALLLSRFLREPVIDETGLKAAYEIELQWTPESDVRDGPSIYTAIQQQLGLKLESRKDPVNILVIDHTDRNPGAN